MKAEDLMIGSRVRYNGKICQIAQVRSTIVLVRMRGDYTSLVPIEALSPILLTEKLLAKNGWQEYEENEYRHQYPQGTLAASFYQWGKEMVCSISAVNNADVVGLCDVKYVHELQHVLSVLGVKEKFAI